mgnify:CR=1 FL=1|tara:strand:- start:115781 stop:116551 length:771 start_codon:yes stop_codon:yes gene_type:complete
MAARSQSIDYLTLFGIALSLIAVIGGNLLEGGHTDSLFQLTAFVIVMGGTTGAILVQTPLNVFLHAMQRLPWIVLPPPTGDADTLKKVTLWSRVVRKDGLLGLQKNAEREADPFIKKGLMLLMDGSEPEDIRKILEVEIDSGVSRELRAARVYEAMGGYSPTIGIIGAVMGLIHVMNNLTDPSALGPGIAVAFVATIYGVGFANFLFLPISNKLKTIVDEQAVYQEMLVDGIVAIAEGENPRVIQSKLEGYLTRPK